jgi:hypothetical protein
VNRPARLLFVVLLLGGAALAACGGDDDGSPPPNRIITIQPQPDATILPGCQTGELESWYEVAGSLITTFNRESLAAIELDPEQMSVTLNRLIDLRNAIAGQPTPECAIPAQTEILLTIRGMLTAFERYTNGEIPQEDMSQQIKIASDKIDTDIAALLESTQSDLEEQLRQERQEAATSP